MYPQLTENIVIQIYNEQELIELRAWKDAPRAALTLYRLSLVEAFELAQAVKVDDPIEWVAMYSTYFLKGAGKGFSRKSIPVFLNTINSSPLAWLAIGAGVKGIYTDNL